eukprot:scaffold1834_cov331-Prasinococcus_capsulatus_cf.AAC.9
MHPYLTGHGLPGEEHAAFLDAQVETLAAGAREHACQGAGLAHRILQRRVAQEELRGVLCDNPTPKRNSVSAATPR